MTLHSKTFDALRSPRVKFSTELTDTVQKLLDLLKTSSPMSDINYILYANDLKSLPGLKFQRINASWMPIRNVLRILAYVSQLEIDSTIQQVYIESMKCGCDFFEGKITVQLNNDDELAGDYRWQWTAFPGRDTSFDKFTDFPQLSSKISI